jgi:peptidoglycan/LPS O-acetylase OafA/YrhL
MSTPVSNRVTLDALTSFRFFAAMGVLIAHNGQSLSSLFPTWLKNFCETGGSGVLFFFVLSGFILVYANKNKDLSGKEAKKQFFFNRFARIAPLYYLALSFGFVNLFVKGIAGYSLFHVATATVLRLTFLHAWSPWHVLDPEWLTASWTLSVEAFFYAMFPFLFPVVNSKKASNLILLGVGVALIAALQIYFTRAWSMGQFQEKFYYFTPLNYGYSFVLGMCCGRLFLNHRELVQRYALHLFWIGCAFCVFARINKFDPGYHVSTFCYHVGSAILILGLAELKGTLGKIFARKWLVILGEASYALYLFHGPVFSAMQLVIKRLKLPNIEENLPMFVVYAFMTTAVSIASFYWIETPAKNWLLSYRKRILESKS